MVEMKVEIWAVVGLGLGWGVVEERENRRF